MIKHKKDIELYKRATNIRFGKIHAVQSNENCFNFCKIKNWSIATAIFSKNYECFCALVLPIEWLTLLDLDPRSAKTKSNFKKLKPVRC